MEQVRRWDMGAVGAVERTDQGYLRAPATITRTGVFQYRQPGGSVRRELRLPDEVFSPKAMQSFGLAPLTNGHPPVMLNSRNTARYQVGSVVEPRQDGDHVAAYVQVTDADAIQAAEDGRRQLSCGYLCNLDFAPGVTSGIPGVPDGLEYDAIQRDIRGNHVALVDKGRAGSTVQLRLDGADGFQVDPEGRVDADPSQVQTLIFDPDEFDSDKAIAWAKEHGFADVKGVDKTETGLRIRQHNPGDYVEGSFRTIELRPGIKAVIGRRKKTDGTNHGVEQRPESETKPMAETQVKIDGVSFDTTSQVAEAVGKLLSRCDELEATLAEAKKSASEQQARADAAEESLAAEKAAHEDSLTPDKVTEAVKARLALERAAAPILGSEVKVDEMSDVDIKRAVVLAVARDKDLTTERLDAGDELYLAARYDAALEAWQPPEEPKALGEARKAAASPERVDTADDARKRMIDFNRKLGREPLRKGA